MADTEKTRGSKLFEPVASMAPHQMAIAGLLAVASLLAIMGLWRWANAPSYQTLMVGEEPALVADAIAELEAGGIDYRVSAGGTAIDVPRDRLADAEVRLASAGLATSTVPGYELLDQQGFSTSSFQQRISTISVRSKVSSHARSSKSTECSRPASTCRFLRTNCSPTKKRPPGPRS